MSSVASARYGFADQIPIASPCASNAQWPALGTTFSVTAKPLPLNAATDAFSSVSRKS